LGEHARGLDDGSAASRIKRFLSARRHARGRYARVCAHHAQRGPAREAFDALKLAPGAAVAADRTVPGLCDWVE
jgi:hypothetical protein